MTDGLRLGTHGQRARAWETVAGFCALVWLGTAAAGGVFGLVADGCAGLVAGPSLAGLGAVLILPTVVIVSWPLCLSRFRAAVGGVAGSATGIVAVMAVSDPLLIIYLSFGWSIVLAGLIGAAGGAAAAVWHRSLTRSKETSIDLRRWQFTLRSLLVRVAVIAALLGAWKCLLTSLYRARENARSDSIANDFRLIGLALQNFDHTEGSLPCPVRRAGGGADPMPAPHITDAKPLYNWRFSILPFMNSSGAQFCFDKSWDDPVQQSWRSHHLPVFCFEEANGQPFHTNIVAITGPGTAFGDGKGEAPWSLRGIDGHTIMAVEVRDSGVHWMAPGDLDVRTISPEINGQDGRGISACCSQGFHVLFADGNVWVLSQNVPFEELEKFFTVEGARNHDREAVLTPYCVSSWGN